MTALVVVTALDDSCCAAQNTPFSSWCVWLRIASSERGVRSRAREASNVEQVPFAARELLSQLWTRRHFK